MKIFKFIGNTFNHIESIMDSGARSAVAVTDTVAEYAETQCDVAKQQRTYTLAEAKAESELNLMDLKIRLNEAKLGKPAQVDTSKSIDDILASL